jgi:N-acylneuraminate cytidylyltransferase
MSEAIAIIPARGGSKRIPRKNLKSFLGKPIIQYAIEAAINSDCFSEIVVSTDDSEIATIAKDLGASVPFYRSSENSSDYATTMSVISEVFDFYTRVGKHFAIACCIYPTAVFTSKENLIHAYNLLINSEADSVIPVIKFGYPVFRAFSIKGDKLSYQWPEFQNTRSQDLPNLYHDSGQFYFFRTEPILKKNSLVTTNSLPLILSETEAQDIDNEEDWRMAEIKYKLFKKYE